MNSHLTDEHRRLEQLAGRWTGVETVADMGQTSSVVTARLGLEGLYLISDYEQHVDGAVVFRGHGVYGWSATQQRYTMNWFDTAGETPPAFGVWQEQQLVFDNQRERARARYVYTITAADSYTLRIEQAPDGSRWRTFLDGTYTRVAAH
ncbi:MAG: DUF1579 family protein [Myxococcales bacterium]|nr:DUF1579 family protein [Myxococcales bacterium]